MTTPMPDFAANKAARVLAGFRGHYVTGSRAANAQEVAKGLPVSFRVLNHLCAGGRIYKTYHGPDGHSYRSISQAKEHPNIFKVHDIKG